MKKNKLIYMGWDAPTTAQLRRDLPAMARAPFDGVVLWAQAKGSDLPAGINGTPFREGFSRTPWKRAWFTHAINDLKAVKSQKTPLTDNFLRLDANPGDVDWFDDVGWTAIAEHFGIAAWVAKQGGLKGVLFDAEPYVKPFYTFDYKANLGAKDHSFDAYRDKARQRGRELMRAMRGEFPDMHVMTCFMMAYLIESNMYHGPSITRPGIDSKRALFLHSYGLLPAFLNGWLDEIGPEMRLTDGNEHAYYYSKPESFFEIATRIKTEALALIAPENRAKYRKQVLVGAGIYIDAHAPGLTLKEYEQPVFGAKTLQKNVAAALSACDGYVWLYGERGRFCPDPRELSEWPKKEVQPTWESRIPGISAALVGARKPVARVGQARPHSSPGSLPSLPAGTPNLLVNSDFAQGPPEGKASRDGVGASADWGDVGAPESWFYWQKEFSRGRFDWDSDKKAARAAGVLAGTFLQNVAVKSGERYLLRAVCRMRGTGLGTLAVQYKDSQGKWLPNVTSTKTIQPVSIGGDGAETFGLVVTIPEGAALLVILLGMEGQPTLTDTLWWERAEVFRLSKEN